MAATLGSLQKRSTIKPYLHLFQATNIWITYDHKQNCDLKNRALILTSNIIFWIVLGDLIISEGVIVHKCLLLYLMSVSFTWINICWQVKSVRSLLLFILWLDISIYTLIALGLKKLLKAYKCTDSYRYHGLYKSINFFLVVLSLKELCRRTAQMRHLVG